MDIDKILELIFSIAPAVVVGAVAYYFFQQHIENENKRRHFLLKKIYKKKPFLCVCKPMSAWHYS